jgi:hypothetical protein
MGCRSYSPRSMDQAQTVQILNTLMLSGRTMPNSSFHRTCAKNRVSELKRQA